jgi:peptidoglycan hydrolase-like protein with peptidoglycan-binding domain
MKKLCAVFFFMLILEGLFAQDFSRVIQLQNRRMNGADVTRLQTRLLALGFKKVGRADGWYGPLTEGAVRTLQYYLGFPRDGRVTKTVWTAVFDTRREPVLKNIGLLSAYNQNSFTVVNRRNGNNGDFDDFLISSLNNEVKTVLFQHVNEGLLIFRFRVHYLPDTVFLIQDVYYGDYRLRVYIKNAQGFFELKNGNQVQADPALEGILNRVKEGVSAAGLTAPAPAASSAPAVQPTPPAPAPVAPASTPAPAAPEPAPTPSASSTPPADPANPAPASQGSTD